MKANTYVIMTNKFETYCGKRYEVDHIGLLLKEVDNPESESKVSVRFPIHGQYGASDIPSCILKEAPDQDKAKHLYKLGEEKDRCMKY